MLSTRLRVFTRAWTALVLVFVYAPLLLVVVNAFNSSKSFAFPPTGLTLQWWRTAWHSEGMWTSLGNSVVIGLIATAIALVLGTMVAFAVQRYEFFGKQTVNLLVVLPITLPGIVTGIALNATFTSALGIDRRLGEDGVGVGESRLIPRPVWVVRGRRDGGGIVGQKPEGLRMPGFDADEFGGTDGRERHRPQVGRPGLGGTLELNHGQSAYQADVAVGRGGAEPPDHPAPMVIGGRLVGPTPRGVHPVAAGAVV